MKKLGTFTGLLAGLVLLTAWVGHGDAWRDDGMRRGTVELVSVGPITFSPEGTLFLGDTYGASIYAVDLEEEPSGDAAPADVEDLDARVASLLGSSRDEVRIHDIAVSPVSRRTYLSVSRSGGEAGARIKNPMRPGATPHLVRLDVDGRLREVDLDDVRFARASVRDVRDEEIDRRGNDRRAWNILEMSYVDDVLYVSGMSNEEWTSKLRRLPYPFGREGASNALRIFHTAHGRYETYAPARVFVPYVAGAETRIFAGFSCTPLVDFSLAEMERNERVEGRTIAELGAGNHVLDMISVERDGETYFLLANHLHAFMRLALSDFDGADAMTRPTGRGGIDRTALDLEGVTRLANDHDERIVMLQQRQGGVDLRAVEAERLLD